MPASRRGALAVALVVAAVDLAQEALTPTPFHHPRSAAGLAAMALLAAAVLALAPRAPSRVLTLAAGVAAGGAIGNALSGLLWRSGVPDPLVHGGYAFNLADVAVVLGASALVTGALVLAWDRRHRLREPI